MTFSLTELPAAHRFRPSQRGAAHKASRVLAHTGSLPGWPRSLRPTRGKPRGVSGTYRGHLIVAFVGDDVGEEVPAHSGLLDVVGQDFSRLIRAGAKTEENVPGMSTSRSKRVIPRAESNWPPVSQATCVRCRAEWTARWPCPFTHGQMARERSAPSSDCEESCPTILLQATVWFSGPFRPLVCYLLRDGDLPAPQDDQQSIQPPQCEDSLQGLKQIAASLGL